MSVVAIVLASRRLDLELHYPVLDSHFEGLDRQVRRKRLRTPRAHVEERSVARALHCTRARVEFPLGERPVVVRAAILDRDELTAHAMEDADLPAVDLDQVHLTLGELVDRADVNGVASALSHVIPSP